VKRDSLTPAPGKPAAECCWSPAHHGYADRLRLRDHPWQGDHRGRDQGARWWRTKRIIHHAHLPNTPRSAHWQWEHLDCRSGAEGIGGRANL